MSSCTRSEEHTSELQSQFHLVCRLLLEKKKKSHSIKLLGSEYVHHAGTLDVNPSQRLSQRTPRHQDQARTRPLGIPSDPFFFKERGPPQIFLLPPPRPLQI